MPSVHETSDLLTEQVASTVLAASTALAERAVQAASDALAVWTEQAA